MFRLVSRSAFALVLAVGLLGLTATNALAAAYGNFVGSTVQFLGVSDLNGLYGAPNDPAGLTDTLDFSPSGFEADCFVDPGCPPVQTVVSDTLTLQIDANPGSFIDQLLLTEAGDTNLSSFINAVAATSVTANVFIDVLEIDNLPVNSVNANAAMVFTNGGAFEHNDEGYGTHLWSGQLLVDLPTVIANAGATGQATLIEISLSNTLTAYNESGATARIEKKDVDGLAITIVPEPGTALLMGLGLAGLASIRRAGG